MNSSGNSSGERTIRYRFGRFELDPSEGALSRSGTRVKLQDLPFRLLVLLVEHPGEIVTREEVRRHLWPQDTFVEFDNSLGVAVRKLREALHDDADAPHFIETVPRRGYRFLAPVTVQGSAEAESAQKGTGNLPIQSEESGGLAKTPAQRVRYGVIAALVLVLVGGVIYEFRSVSQHSSSTAEAGAAETDSTMPPPRVRRSVAVLGFRNLPGRPEEDWLSAAFSEMLSTELAAGGGLRLVSGEDVARAKRELPLADEDTLAKATLQRLRTNPGADVVVLGSYTPLPGNGKNRIRLDIRLQDTAAGETISEEALTGDEENLFELASQAGGRLRQSLGVSPVPAEGSSAARASLPSNQQAVQLYAKGRAKLWAFDFLGARDLLVKAVDADPNYPLSHSALSEAWWHMGHGPKARAEAQRALQLSGHLPQEERLLVEGQYRRTIADWPKSVEAYRSLFRLFPDSLDYGLLLASAQIHVKPADSLQTLATLRRLPSPTSEDARIDMMEASAWIGLDLNKAQAAAKRAIAKGSAQGSHVLVARTYGILCQQAPAIGASVAESISDCEKARQSDIAAGDRDGEATMATDLAGLHSQQGDLADAEAMWREAIKQFRQVGDDQGVAATLNNLGAALLLEGNLDGAKKLLEESIPSYQAIEDKDGVALALNDLGDLSRQKGNLEVAETTYQQAKATAQEIDDKSAVGYVLTGMGDVLTDRGDLTAARKSYEESLALRSQIGEKQTVAETQVALAQLSVEEGQASNAESALHRCKEQFHSEQQADDELAASVVLTGALLAEGKPADARHEVEASEQLAKKSQNRLAQLQFALAAARVVVSSSKPESARAELERILKDARAHGFVGLEFEVRLALAELEERSGRSAAAQAQLLSLERTARIKGFGLIARKAAADRTRDLGVGEKSADHGQG
jgi:eukaryotic-like serine/threonine-protein kinase